MTTSTVSIRKENTALIVAILLALAGIGAWVYQLSQGMQATGLGQQIVWGLYIAAFFTAVGAGATLLALTGASEYLPLFAKTGRVQNLCLALASLFAGGLLITLDVGNPLRIWRIMTAFSLSSLMTWDFWLLVVAGVVALIYMLAARGEKAQKVLGVLGIAAGAAVVVVEGWMLTTMAAHPMWGSGLTVLSFLLGAVIAGMSLALTAGTADESVQGWLKAALWMSLVFVLVDVLTSLMGGGEEASLILAGFAAPVFWLQVLAGVLLPLALLMRKAHMQLAGALAILGVTAEKVWTLAAGQSKPWLSLPEGVYVPSALEVVAVVGMAALGILAYRLLVLVFKVK